MSAKSKALNVTESLTVRLLHYVDRLDTYVQVKAGAVRYREGAGKAPTKAQRARYRVLAEQVRAGKR